MRLAVFNENPGTCILIRRGGLTVAHTEAPFFLCLSVLAGAALWNELARICLCAFFFCFFFWEEVQLANKCRAKPRRPRLPRRSDAEIFIGCLFSFSSLRKKKEDLQFSKQCRLCFCVKVFFFFISVILCSQCEFHTEGRECGGEEGIVFGLRIIIGECEWRDVFSFILS